MNLLLFSQTNLTKQMKKKNTIARAKGIFALVMTIVIAVIATSCNKGSSNPTPTPIPKSTPVAATIDANLLLGAKGWNTQIVIAKKPDSTTVEITTRFDILFLPEPVFLTLPSGNTPGTGTDNLIGEAFTYTYDPTTKI